MDFAILKLLVFFLPALLFIILQLVSVNRELRKGGSEPQGRRQGKRGMRNGNSS